MEREAIFNHCVVARSVFEKHSARYGSLFETFPKGTCGNVSDLLGIWLSQQNAVGIQCVSGSRFTKGALQTHAWLEVDDTVIDITSDQFQDGLGPVYFGERCQFYESFKSQQKIPLPHTYFDIGVLRKFVHDMQTQVENLA